MQGRFASLQWFWANVLTKLSREKCQDFSCISIEDPAHVKFLSIASLWEIAIKTSLGKLTITASLDSIVPEEIHILDITTSHLMELQRLPFHHRDPFDRLIIAQALVEGGTLMSRDRYFKLYKVPLI